ncbi:MAG TPA: methyltransferase [Luteimonas sp.]|nr:methyltransferase [Luteimonas sp.]
MSADGSDSALETLLLPLHHGALDWPDEGALFLRARDGWPLHRQPWPGLVCEQGFKPEVDALQHSGMTIVADDNRTWPLVLVLPPRQRDEARALLVRAVERTTPGGRVLACMPNSEGAKSGEADLRRLAGPLQTQSKSHCRVFWTAPLQGVADRARADAWLVADAPRPILNGRFVSRPGVFAWDRIDAASALLAAHLPDDLAGRGADLGCGYGYLAAEVLARCRGVTAFDLYEAEARALALARTNLQAFARRVEVGFHWHDVASGLPQRHDFIVSNPPFHAQGRADRPDLGRRFIAAAAAALNPGGQLWLVANCHLPYEAVLDASFGTVRSIAQRDGFKVIAAVKSVAGRVVR